MTKYSDAAARIPAMQTEMKALIEAHAPTMFAEAQTEAAEVFVPLFAVDGKYNGQTMEQWVKDRQANAPWCFPSETELAGNPWSKDSWNLTAQGRVARDSLDKAHKLAAAAGSHIGATKANPDPHAAANSTNPWSRSGWNLTRQGALLRANPAGAAQLAAAAGSRIGATKPNF